MNNVQYPRLLAVLPRLLAVMVITISATAIAQTAVPLVNQPLAPVSAAPGSGAFALTVNGTGFVSGAVVNWNGSARTTTFISSSSLQASITATDVANKGTATVTVVNPGAGGGISNRVYFPIRTPLSSVAAVVDNKLSGVADVEATVAGDFDNDGKQDFVTCVNTSTGNFLYFYRGNGGGAFGTPIITTVMNLNPIGYLMTADFNNDGNLDLLVGDSGGADLVASAVFLGDGHGHFHQKPLLAKNLADFGFPTAIGDFNGDGKLDVLYFGQSEDDTALFTILGNGDGTFQPATPTKSIPGLYLWMTVGDFNGDGKLDVAGASEFGESVTIYLGNGDGTFTAGAVYEEGATGMGAADVNGDGKLDLVFNGLVSDVLELCVQLGNGDGTFGSASCSGSAGLNLQFADFNGDGKVDVLGSNFINLGNGDGTFQPPVTLAFLESAPTIVADFNGDGQLDFVSTSRGPGGPVQVLLQSVLGFSAPIFGFATHNVGSTSSPQTLILSNVGTRRLNIASISLTGANPGDFIEHNACGTGIRPGGTCNVQLAFKPTADGARTASLTVTYSGLGNPQSVALLGTGTH